jgi:hypothetical protein
MAAQRLGKMHNVFIHARILAAFLLCLGIAGDATFSYSQSVWHCTKNEHFESVA